MPGAKKIFLPPAPRVLRPMFEVGDVVTFGKDPQRYVCMNPGDPATGLGATFSFLSGRGLPWGVQMPDHLGVKLPKLPALPEAQRPTAANRMQWERAHAGGRPFGAPW